MTTITGAELIEFYTAVRKRLCATMASLSDAELIKAVPGCPGWTVRDTFSHVVANPQDGLAGRILGIPDDEFTAGQVERLADVSVADLVSSWQETGPQMEPMIASAGVAIAPLVIDAHIHEQDILNALGRNEARDVPGMVWIAAYIRSGYPGEIPASDYEVARARLGRRSAAQVAAWPWPDGFDADAFFNFGPRDTDLVE
jgi:uncharacterized protein (TIGR03083 family)